MTRSILELRKTFKRKITTLEKELDIISHEELLSESRQEFATQIAMNLRAMFCHSGGEPLIQTAQIDKDLFFPLYDRLTPFNELPDFLLVGNQCKDNHCTFQSDTTIRLDGAPVPTTLMSYYSWIKQIVIDLKTAEFAPLSREDVIKIIADRDGAHIDPKIHPFVELIESSNVMPFHVIIRDKECPADCSNLLRESIITMAKEVVFAYKYLNKPIFFQTRDSEIGFSLRVFDYSDDKRKRYKYTICSDCVNLYDTNRKWSCEITSHPIKHFEFLFRSRRYPVDVIRIEDCGL